MEKNIIGIDFGHGECAASCIKRDGSLETLQINKATRTEDRKIPSLIYKVPDGKGEYRYDLDKQSGIIINFKSKISDLDSDTKVAFKEFIKQVVARIIDNNGSIFKDAQSNEYIESLLYIAAPTSWSADEQQDYKAFFNEALSELNKEKTEVGKIFGNPPTVGWIINESDAAFYAKQSRGYVLVIDYGSSTIDYTLMRNNSKVPGLDCLSSNLGASAIENEIFINYKNNPESDYSKAERNTNRILQEQGLSHIDADAWIKYLIRQKKEEAYSKNETADVDIKVNVVKRAANIDEKSCAFHIENVNIDETVKDYKKCVHDSFDNLKNEIVKILGTEALTSIILSGGASIMGWVKEMVQEVFVTGQYKDCTIQLDDHPSFIVSEGLVKYAQAQQNCLAEITAKCELQYRELYEKAWNCAIKKSIEKDLKNVCNDYGSSPVDNNAEFFLDSLKSCLKRNAESQDFKDRLGQELKSSLIEQLKEIVRSVLSEKFGIEEIDDKCELTISDIDVLPFNEQSYSGRLESWLKTVYKDPEIIKIRETEHPEEPGFYSWAIWGLSFTKKRGSTMRQVFEAKTFLFIMNGETKFALQADEKKWEKILNDMKVYAIKCAEELFYRNEIFKTKIKV